MLYCKKSKTERGEQKSITKRLKYQPNLGRESREILQTATILERICLHLRIIQRIHYDNSSNNSQRHAKPDRSSSAEIGERMKDLVRKILKVRVRELTDSISAHLKKLEIRITISNPNLS